MGDQMWPARGDVPQGGCHVGSLGRDGITHSLAENGSVPAGGRRQTGSAAEVVLDVEGLRRRDGIGGQLRLQGQQPVLGPVISEQGDYCEHDRNRETKSQDGHAQHMGSLPAAGGGVSGTPLCLSPQDWHVPPPPGQGTHGPLKRTQYVCQSARPPNAWPGIGVREVR